MRISFCYNSPRIFDGGSFSERLDNGTRQEFSINPLNAYDYKRITFCGSNKGIDNIIPQTPLEVILPIRIIPTEIRPKEMEDIEDIISRLFPTIWERAEYLDRTYYSFSRKRG